MLHAEVMDHELSSAHKMSLLTLSVLVSVLLMLLVPEMEKVEVSEVVGTPI